LFGKDGSLDVGLRIAQVFFLPVWLLYIPLVFKLKDSKNGRIWIMLGSGLLLGPVVIAIWCGVSIAQGATPSTVWHGDPLVASTAALMILSAFLTLAIVGIYGMSLKFLGYLSGSI
jgi:hypothetical protein